MLFVMDDMVLACHVVIQGLERMIHGFPAQRGFGLRQASVPDGGLAARECFRLTRRPLPGAAFIQPAPADAHSVPTGTYLVA